MNIERLIREKEAQLGNQSFVQFSQAELDALRDDEILRIVEHFHGHTLMKLPETEIAFFEWLRENDPQVWDDIWGGEEELYLVSTDLLKQFGRMENGFPICDLIEQPNYWFTARHLKPKSQEVLQDIIEKQTTNGRLTADEMLLLEIAQAAIDIWHFCYKYRLDVETGRAIVDELSHNGLLVHLTDREDLLRYLDL